MTKVKDSTRNLSSTRWRRHVGSNKNTNTSSTSHQVVTRVWGSISSRSFRISRHPVKLALCPSGSTQENSTSGIRRSTCHPSTRCKPRSFRRSSSTCGAKSATRGNTCPVSSRLSCNRPWLSFCGNFTTTVRSTHSFKLPVCAPT